MTVPTDSVDRSGTARAVATVVGCLLSILLIVVGVLALVGPGRAAPTDNLVGTKVTAFTVLPGVGGGSVRAPWLGHHAAVLLFFADDCPPCHAELPELARALGAGRLGHAVVVGIDGDHSPAVAASFVRANDVRFSVGQDANLAVASTLIGALPATVFVTSRGTVAAIHYGVITASQVRAVAATLT